MTGWIVLLVLAILVLLVCLVRLGVAAGYDERGGWVKVHLGPKWVTLYPIDPHKAAKRQEKKARKAEKKAQKPTQEEPDKPTLGGALDLALDLLPDVKEAAGRFRRRLRIDDLTLYLEWGEPDPADAAIHYGQAWGAAEAIAAFLEANFRVKHRDLSLDLNYQLDKPRLTLRAALSLTVAQLLAIVLPLGWAVMKTICNRRKQRQEAAAAAPERKGEANHGKEPSCQ